MSVQRVDPLIYTLITNKYATLKEIRDDYSIEEVLDLYEICLTQIYNKYQMQEELHGQLQQRDRT